MKLKDKEAQAFSKGYSTTGIVKLDEVLADERAFAFDQGVEWLRNKTLNTVAIQKASVKDASMGTAYDAFSAMIKELGNEQVL
jgi:hypothetical protein